MKIDKERMANSQKAFNSIVLGTAAGLLTYYAFLYYNIAIFGWNLGLIFAPLVAGYVETIIAQKIIGESIGAISAFILFLVTVVYGFIIANPTLGYNVITFGSIIIIIQAAIPTFINYFGLVVIISMFSYLTGFFKKLTDTIDNKIRKLLGKEERPVEIILPYDDEESNKKINSLDFAFITSNNPKIIEYDNIGYFYTTAIFERNTHLLHISPENVEKKHLNELKKGKDECLIKLSEEIKNAGGNGVIDLEINYILNGLGGSSFQIIASGMAVYIKVESLTS
ncbi:hypothetical protein [uncultured Methanobrevibacter sp.]|uniref:hypothetical protein n=1 Tax=uncultured Methanobrevibacter sp. TaxID=253161 RepID=UPI0025D8D5B0|nr:hypothetical protein [uncultured Methanobrevibacter sp.]